LAAVLNAGDCGSSVCGTTMNEPGRPNAIAIPTGLAGGELTGSGKPDTPWARMHWERRSIVSFWSPVAGDGPPPPGISDLHAFCACWNAGELTSTEFGICTPPPPEGSEKFGTPLARMQAAYLIPGSRPAPWLGLAEEPHPASSSPPSAAAMTVRRFTRGVVAERR
jgi:hypothetical protein